MTENEKSYVRWRIVRLYAARSARDPNRKVQGPFSWYALTVGVQRETVTRWLSGTRAIPPLLLTLLDAQDRLAGTRRLQEAEVRLREGEYARWLTTEEGAKG